MGASELLRLVVDADVQGAVSGLKKVGDTTTKELGKSEKTIDKWGKGFSKAGVGMVAFGAAALVGLGAMAKRSEEANLSTVKLQNSLSANPRLAGTSAKGFIDLAQAIQNKTAADGDDIVAGMAVLAQGKLQARQIRELTPLVVDLARKKGIDEVSAFTLASKAVAGNAGALKRAGIQVDETAFKTDAYGATVDALKSSVGGFAQAEGKTFEGSLQRAKNQLGDLEEGVGAGAVDAFTSFLSVVGKASVKLNEISPGAQAAIGKIATFGAVGLIAAGGVSTLIGSLIKMRKNFSDAIGAIGNLKDSLGGFGGAAAFTGFTVGATILVTELEKIGDEADKRTIDKVTSQLNNLGSTFDTGLADKITKWAKAARESDTDFVFKNFSKILDNSVPAARRFIEVVDGLDASTKKLIGAGTIERMKAAVEDKSKADVAGAAAQSAYSDEVQKGATALDSQANSAESAAKKISDLNDMLHAAIDPLFGMTDALQQNAEAAGKVDAATVVYLKAVKAHGPTSKEAVAALKDLRAAQLDSGKSALNVSDAVAKLNAAVAKNPALLGDAKAQLEVWRRQGVISASTAAFLAGKFDGAAASGRNLGGAIKGIPGHKTVTLATSGFKNAQVAIQKVKDSLANTPGYKSITIDLHVTGAAAVQRAEAKLLGPGHAAGGPVQRGMVYPVGEHGPELFAPATNGMIIPNSKITSLGAGVAGAFGGDTYNIHVDKIVADDPKRLFAQLQQHMKNTGPLRLKVRGGL